MNSGSPDLERLISRCLDHEATRLEQRRLRTLERSDPRAAALVDDYVTLDRELGRVLRVAMGRAPLLPLRRTVWPRFGQLAALAAAACLAVMVWISPPQRSPRPDGRGPARASASWFAPSAAVPHLGDEAELQPVDSRPRVRLRDTNRDWILIPGERPGEYMVIEVERVRTRAIAIHDDF
jgi:hypothetical protein